MTFWQYFIAVSRAALRKEGLTFFAYVGAVGAGIVLTAYLFWTTWHLQKNQQHEAVALLANGALLLLGITQLSLHRLLGSKLSLDLEFWKLKAKILQGEVEDVTPPADRLI